MGNTTGKSRYEMKEDAHGALRTCKCKAERLNHGNLQLEDSLPRSRRKEAPFSAPLTFPEQSATFLNMRKYIIEGRKVKTYRFIGLSDKTTIAIAHVPLHPRAFIYCHIINYGCCQSLKNRIIVKC